MVYNFRNTASAFMQDGPSDAQHFSSRLTLWRVSLIFCITVTVLMNGYTFISGQYTIANIASLIPEFESLFGTQLELFKLYTNSPASSISCFLLILTSIVASMRWREVRLQKRNETHGTLRRDREAEGAFNADVLARKIKSQLTKNPINFQPVYSVALKFQHKLSKNRLIRDRFSPAETKDKNMSSRRGSSQAVAGKRQERPQKVLIFGKNKKYIRKLSDVLEKKFKTIESVGGRETLHLVRTERPSLIILGPIVSKNETLSFLRMFRLEASLRDIPVLLLVPKYTEWGVKPHIDAIDDYLETPIQPKKLLGSIEHMVSKRMRAKA